MDRSNSSTFKPSSVVGQREVDKATSSIEPKNLQSGLTTTQFKSGTADIVKDNSLALEAKDLMSSLGKELGELKEVHDRRPHTAFKEINSALALLDKIDNPDDHQTFAGSAELSITARKLKLLVKLLDNKTTHIGKPLPAAPESKHKNDTQLRLKTEGTLKDLLTSLSDVIDQRILAETNLNNIIIKPANSMLLKGLAPGKPLADQIASCQEKIDSCEKAIKDFEANVKLVKEKGTSPGISSIADLSTLHGLQSQINQLRQMKDALGVMLKSLESYQPHDSVKSVCLAKRLELESALQAIPKKNQSNVDINKNLLKFIDCRIEYVNSISENPDRYDTPTLGKPELSGLLAKWHPFDAVRQKTALDKQVKKLRTQISKATNDQDLKKIARSLKTEHFSERMVLMGLMRHADGINDARDAFGQALDQTLRHQNWAPVSCNILIPTSKPENGPVTTETLTTDLVCQGTMMTDAKKIWILSEESPLKPGNFDDFKNTAGKTTGGVRSRSTDETKNPTIAAHTSCRVDDKKIFGATRTGVNDPYGLNKEKLQTKSSAEVAKLTRDVIGLPVWSPTQVRLGDSQSKLLNDVDQTKTTNALYMQSWNAIVEYLLVTDDGQKILTEADVSLNEESLEIRTYVAANFATRLLNQTDTKSNETLARVAISCKPLQMIMRRQGALNRARVTFLFEIQRDAAFAERIKNGKPITFTSISLLTPDRLRQYGFDKFGIDGMNEQEMLDLHVQSWHDLQTEIDSGGLYVNGQAVKAAILPMNFGVNVISFNKFAAAPVIGELICGFKHANTLTNHDSLNRLLGINKSHPDEKSLFDIFIEEQADLLKLTSSDEEKKAIEQNMGVVVQLGQQITDIFRGDKYKTEGNDPYKIASRIALLSFMIGGGTVFNCKSGKDRTGQLDIEAKFLAFQIKTTGKVPDPEIEKTDLQRAQQAILMLFDQTRTKLQEYSTGVTGSKVDLEQLFLNLLSVDENATDQQIRSELDWIKQELQGAAQHSGSM